MQNNTDIERIKSDIFIHSTTLQQWYDSTTIENNNAFDSVIIALNTEGLSIQEMIVRLKKFVTYVINY